jgi:hypothetical protein
MILCFSTYNETTFTRFRVFVFSAGFPAWPRSTLVAARGVSAESSRKITQKTMFGATKNMKKISWTILWLSLHFPKTLKNAYIRAVFSLFAHPDLAITRTATWPLTVTL